MEKVGVLGGVVAQIVMLVMSFTVTSSFWASCALARLWSRRVMAVKRASGMSGVVHRERASWCWRDCPRRDLDVVGGVVVDRFALGGEDRAVGFEEILALHALRAGKPTSMPMLAPSNAALGSSLRVMPASNGSAVVEPIATPSMLSIAGGISSSRRMTG